MARVSLLCGMCGVTQAYLFDRIIVQCLSDVQYIVTCMSLKAGFVLLIGFIKHLQIVTTTIYIAIIIYTLYISLQNALRFLFLSVVSSPVVLL
jgi:hypothetical protein